MRYVIIKSPLSPLWPGHEMIIPVVKQKEQINQRLYTVFLFMTSQWSHIKQRCERTPCVGAS